MAIAPRLDRLPLHSGDHLTRAEFERRYAMWPGITAELIEGVVYVASPVSLDHSKAHARLNTWLGTYQALVQGVEVADNTTLRLDLENEPQPDAVLYRPGRGNAIEAEDRYLEGAPEFVAEVAVSSVSYDLHEKLRAYRRNGVQEYLVWRVLDNAIDWFELQEGEYVQLPRDGSGIVESRVFPGLRLDVPALLEGRMQDVLTALQPGRG